MYGVDIVVGSLTLPNVDNVVEIVSMDNAVENVVANCGKCSGKWTQ